MNYTSPADIGKEFLRSADQKSRMPFGRQLIYSILGGAFVSLGALLAITVAGGMPGLVTTNPGITKFVFGAIFPVGLIMIVIGGAQLFTSDCAILPFGSLHKKLAPGRVLQIWSVVYLGNFAGALIVAYLFAWKAELLTAEPWNAFTVKLAEGKIAGSFMKVFTKAIGANWLVCMAVWMSYAAKDVTGKIVAMWFPVMCFVALGLEHSIANMFFIPTAILMGADISISEFLINNLLPATAGNIVGGALMVAAVYFYMFNAQSTREVDHGSITNGRRPELTEFEKRLN